MVDFIFSVTNEVFEKVIIMLNEIDQLEKEWDKNMDDENERLKIIKMQDELKYKITKILIESGEKHEELMVVDEEFDEGSMVLHFGYYFGEYDSSMKVIQERAMSPETVSAYFIKLLTFLENDGKKNAIEYCKEEIDYYRDEEQIEEIFDKWISILKHASENGNWYYHHVEPV
jgi:hypothetical protein